MNCLVMIFSRNRAFQLDATLRSFLLHCHDAELTKVRVLFTTTDALHTSQYEKMNLEYNKHPFIRFVCEQDFRSDVLTMVARFDHVFFLVDDTIFVREFSIQKTVDAFSRQPDALACSFRLGRNTTYSYMSNAEQSLPSFTQENFELLKYSWSDAQHDFGYPLELSSSIYRVSDIYEVIAQLPFSNPNTLEGQLAEKKENFIKTQPFLLCYEQSVAFSNPLNLVQTAWENRVGQNPQYTSQRLAEKFAQGYRVNVESFSNFLPQAVHQEVALKMEMQGWRSLGNNPMSRVTPSVVSVVIPCYQQAEFLPEAVNSVVLQTYSAWEIIIVDDGSSDNTSEVAASLSRKFPERNIQLIKQSNMGLAEARNVGIRASSGSFILPLDADDIIAPTMLERLVQILETRPDIGIAYPDTATFGEVTEYRQARDWDFPILCTTNILSYCALYRKEVWETVGGYNPNMNPTYEDWDFWIGCGEKGVKGLRIPEPLFIYRVRKNTLASVGLKHDKELKARIILNHPTLYKEALRNSAREILGDDVQGSSSFISKEAECMGSEAKANCETSPTIPSNPSGDSSRNPLVTIIVPTKNRSDMLIDAVRSILTQTHRHFEIIVINDGGGDVEGILSNLDSEGRIVYVRLPQSRERSFARNLGITLAHGKYIAYLDDDDQYYPQHLETLVDFLERTGNQVAYADAYRVHQVKENGRYVTKSKDLPYSKDFDGAEILVNNFIPNLCLMHAKACVEKVGGFESSLEPHEDWEFLIRLSQNYSIHHVKAVTAEFSWRMDGSTSSSARQPDFLRTRELIYEKYRAESQSNPQVWEAQQQILGKEEHSSQVTMDCSIIIPVFNKMELTQNCLVHLAKVTNGNSYEVIIVDNASTDGTHEFLSSLGGDIRIIRNDENLGFAKACNQGAKAAIGKYLVFLNNDTIPQVGWLSPLVEEVELHVDVAVVGSKLLFPDKTVQHAGVVFSRKPFMPYHLFSGAAENLPAANVRKEFQAVTAACMLVKRESFKAVGGFDEEFINGFEDVDFCLKIRESGERVVYQPKSMLYHLAHQTSGRKNPENEVNNYQRLRERWEETVTPDEDTYYVSAGYKNTLYVKDGILRPVATPFVDEEEKAQWNNLEQVQRLLLQKQYAKESASSSDYDSELRALLSHASQWPKDKEALRWAALICNKHKFHEYEDDFWTQMLELDEDCEAREYLVSSALKQKKFPETTVHLQVLLATNPQSGIGHFLQGVLFLQLTQYESASESFRRAVELGFDHLKAEKGLGLACLSMGNANEAWRVYAKVLENCPDDVEVINGLLQAGTTLGWWDELAKILTQYLERNPGNLDMRFALASVAYRAGQSVQAMQQLAFLKLMKPDFDGLLDLERLLAQEASANPIGAILKNYSCDLNSKVWRRSGYSGIGYSDGKEIEQRLQRIVETSGDVSVMSVELSAHCTDWPTWYHLSSHRSNILRPFEEQLRGHHVLEIGAGCGAISRYLGEVGAEVLALEGTPQRAAIAASRCRDLPNVSVVTEAIQNLEPIPQFDVVTLIGVLEYARIFFPGAEHDSVDAMLKYVHGFLKPGGKLVLAIENQLGLKYFAGFPEDHMGKAMFGIEEHYRENGVVTFGRSELGTRLTRAGFSVGQWWYPFPDYKLSTLMVSEKGVMPQNGMDLFSLVRNACAQDPQYPSSVSFNLERAWRPIVRNGLLRDMANSFLVIASNVEAQDPLDGTLAIHYATARRPEFSKKVVFSQNIEGEIMALPMALYPQVIPTINFPIKLRLERTPYIQGQLWHDRLVDIMTSPDWTFAQVQEWFQVWFDAFKEATGIVGTGNLQFGKISGTYIDLVPRNLIVAQDGACTFFDQEWEYDEAVEVGYVILRALTTSIMTLRSFSTPFEQAYRQPLTLILKLSESVGFAVSNQYVKDFLGWERTFQECVTGVTNSKSKVLYPAEKDDLEVPPLLENFTKKQSSSACFECSIIIPVFNKLELTQQCLMHLAEVTKEISYEVVIVDNHSSDGTSEFLQSLDGDIQIIQNSTNVGFAKGCNQGAQAAKGKHLVFLNNDTIPRPGWLEALVHEVDAHPDVAVVGSKLLYPDNTIQHAGVVFSRLFHTPYHLFSGAPENIPAANVRKEYQAVTAACMLVRKNIFEKIGGFDEGFVNGFEDVDLCLKIRKLGEKVIYQPQSCLYHLESQSSGRQNYDDHNLLRLLAGWKHQWLGDEDLMAAQGGYIIRQEFSEERLLPQLIPMHDVAHPVVWQRAVDLQQILLGRECQPLAEMTDGQKVRELLVDVEGWPNDIGVLAWVGEVCERLHLEQEAVQFWQKLLTIGDHANARLGLARSMLKNGNLDEAQGHLEMFKCNFIPTVEGWSLQGIFFMQRQEYSEAKHAFEESLAIEGANRKARMGLGMAYMGLGEAVEAWRMFEQVVSVDPDDIEAIRCLIQAGTVLQRWEDLATHLSRFIERNPADCAIRFALAGVQFRDGQIDKANQNLTWLRLVKPEYEGIEDLEKLLATPQDQSNLVSVR